MVEHVCHPFIGMKWVRCDIWILRLFRGPLTLLEVRAWILTSQSKWKSFTELKSRNIEFQVEDCIFLKSITMERGEELRAS